MIYKINVVLIRISIGSSFTFYWARQADSKIYMKTQKVKNNQAQTTKVKKMGQRPQQTPHQRYTDDK